MAHSSVINAIATLVEQSPDDVPLRLHLASLLLQEGRASEATAYCAAVLTREPENADALDLLALARRLAGGAPTAPLDAPVAESHALDEQPEAELPEQIGERPRLRLDDVGGLDAVKQRLRASLIGPLERPDLRELYGKSLRGGLLLYGPPGCGKTFVARAVAGELSASFFAVSPTDILDRWLGGSERRLHEYFEAARREAPSVLFFDELDALGQKRTALDRSAARGVVSQLLVELDGIDGMQQVGVFVLAATNHPWDVDPALRRPGRFDRVVLVMPPDLAAREAILRFHLTDRHAEKIDLGWIARHTEGFSGADLSYLCEAAAESALASALGGEPRPISMRDFRTAVEEAQPSTTPWFKTARNYALFSGEDHIYDDLLAYMRKQRIA